MYLIVDMTQSKDVHSTGELAFYLREENPPKEGEQKKDQNGWQSLPSAIADLEVLAEEAQGYIWTDIGTWTLGTWDNLAWQY